MRFVGTTADRDGAEFVVVGVPLDATTSHRAGTRRAPTRVREASLSFETYVRGADTDIDGTVHDYGDVDAWDDARETVEFVEGVVDEVADGAVPVMVGGEHTVSVAGYRGVDADSVVLFDAHLDLKQQYRGNPYSHACVARHAVEDGRDVYIVGAREGSRDEWEYAESHDGVTLLDSDEMDEIDADAPYVSVDLDVLDSGDVSGVGTPVPFGVSSAEIRDAVAELAPRAVGFDVVEACPAYGEDACYVAAALVRDFVAFASD